jgi:hypothetical protein
MRMRMRMRMRIRMNKNEGNITDQPSLDEFALAC